MVRLTSKAGAAVRAVIARVHAAGRWRGADGEGVSLYAWIPICAVGGAWAVLLGPREPFVAIVPMLLAAAALLPGVCRLFAEPAVRRSLKEAEVPIVLAATAAFAYHVFGPPLDNGVLVKTADHFVIIDHIRSISDALSEGRWSSWTDVIQGGEPLGFLYPVLFDAVVAALYATFGGQTELALFYTYAVLVCWCLRGLAVYFLARRFAGAPIASLLSLASLLDTGANLMDGNWYAVFVWGMLESNVALTIATFAFAALLDVASGRQGVRLVVAVVLVGLSAVAHPIGLLVMMLAATGFLLTALICRQGAREAAWASGAAALGLLIAAFYTMPTSFLLTQLGFVGSAPGNDLEQAGLELLKGSVPDSSFAAFNGFAVMAVVVAIITREARLVVCALCALCVWMIDLTPVLVEAEITRYLPSLLTGQARRVVGVLKVLAVGPMAWLLQRTIGHLGSAGSTRVRPVLSRALIATLLVIGFGRSVVAGLDRLVRDLRGQFASAPEIPPEQVAAFDWLAQLRRADPNPAQWRAAIMWKRAPHSAWAEGARIGVPIVDFRWVSGTFLTFRPREKTLAGFRDWAIRFAITDYPEPPIAGMSQVWNSGPFVIWQNPEYDGRSVVAPDGVSVEGLQHRGDRIRFVVRGAGAGTEIVVRTAWFPRWRARLNGGEIPLRPKAPRWDAKPKQDQIAITARDGEVLLTCDRLPPRGAEGIAISVLGLGALAGVARARRRERVERWLRAAYRRIVERLQLAWHNARLRERRLSVAMAVLLISAAAATSWLRGRRHLHLTSWSGLGGAPFLASGPKLLRCSREFWWGRWRCPANVVIDWWVGGIPVRDDSGEWATLFPGTQIRGARPETEIWFRFSRVRVAGRQLGLWVRAAGGWNLTIRVDGDAVARHEYVNEDRRDIVRLLDVRHATGQVELIFQAFTPDARLIFDAWTK